ncbi:methionine ABC transporter ATP-binding protein [Bulleidia sp. zg-1006]|uniref:methionine ABC transporter ATP-binding protein n=1 Tax=Bulleidia sp. zg-1006 TaxID=2806552 RepID=UPI00193984DB|nr:ATP-binding cassette domain-containing protein [Bulleidia sp. zg-1006]QRG86525.1 ATP-binding cassette domain-containing protein [Bulleidia sp. zg-1006]
MIEIKNVSKTFATKSDSIHAVEDVTLNIQEGEIFGIIGYSGAGKSTLVRLINQLEKQTSGEIWIDGVNIGELNKKDLNKQRQSIGMIFQHFNLLWSRTVQKNIELPLELAGMDKEERKKKVKELIELVGLSGRENFYPSELSGGQKQRVGIARALANRPKILLCDEATSALDPETTEQILSLLREINQKLHLTIAMITHQMEVVQKVCHRMAVMEEGKIVELGLVEDLFSRPKHAVTRKFVQNIEADQSIEDLAKSLKSRYPDGQLLRVSFTGNNADQPIIIHAARKVLFDVSIVESNISQSASGPMGVTYIHLSKGNKEDYEKFVKTLVESNVGVEVLS